VAPLLEQVGEVFAAQELHHEERRAGRLVDAGVEGLDDVLAVDVARGLRLEPPRRCCARYALHVYAGHLDLTQPLVWTVDDALSPADCAAYVAKLRAGDPEIAPIVGAHGGPEVDLAVRNNTRVMWDDAAEADALLARVASRVPARLSGMVLAGANPRLRLYRYGPGERHGAHWDTVVELSGGVRSLVTLVFYLNDGFEGGETDFPELSQQVVPRAGRALLFQHRILHEATSVRAGEKLVLRTDVLYRPPG
jgi:hypothetical protein